MIFMLGFYFNDWCVLVSMTAMLQLMEQLCVFLFIYIFLVFSDYFMNHGVSETLRQQEIAVISVIWCEIYFLLPKSTFYHSANECFWLPYTSYFLFNFLILMFWSIVNHWFIYFCFFISKYNLDFLTYCLIFAGIRSSE
jgi:hypothetical protein